MNLEQHKTKIIQKLQTLKDEKMLDEIDAILEGNHIVGYTIGGKPLTKNQYSNHIEFISKSVANGAKTYTTEEVRNHVFAVKSKS